MGDRAVQKNKSPLGFRWPFLLGGFGFFVGFFGPMIIDPNTHQGPLLGILITGPLGVVAGFVLWALSSIFKWSPQTQWRTFYTCCGLYILSMIAMILVPRPEWVGRIYEIEVASCIPVSAAAEEGSVVTARIDSEKVVRRDKPLFKDPSLKAFKITTRTRETRSFYIAGPCAELPNGSKHTYFVSSTPSNEIGRRLKLMTLLPLPDEMKGL